MRQLYREIADLKVRNELLEQSVRDKENGMFVFWNSVLSYSLSDERIMNDYQQLKSKVASLQQTIDNQNEMLDEAQSIMQQLKVLLLFVFKK